MADSTLRLTVDIEPRFANEAFQLFGRAGQPVALAALKPATSEPEKPKGGPLSEWVAIRCKDHEFQNWLSHAYSGAWRSSKETDPEKRAADAVRVLCSVGSRAELDNMPEAAQAFSTLIRGPWHKHCLSTY